MATKLWAIGLIVLMTALTSTAQLLYKAGIGSFPQCLDLKLVLGLAIYAVGAVMLLYALKGGEVTVLYPIIATSYIWVGIFAWLLFGEGLGAIKIAGLLTILCGITILSAGSQKRKRKTR